MPNEKKITEEFKKTVLDLRKKGYTYNQIGKMTDTSAYMVAEICRCTLRTSRADSTKQGMADLWIQWDELNHRYGGKKNV